jgi:outer membrane receptor protein involved in Fe transport
VPANVQSATGEALAGQHSLDLAEFMNDALGSVHVNDVQESPLLPDLQYRGFVASPLLGAAEGLSVYLDGARLNAPFGDTVNWDLIPTQAIASVNLMPGSNPIFGLNTLGGALSIETKTGFSDPGADARMSLGSFGRRLVGFGVGGHGERFATFAAAELYGDDGWRQHSPSQTMNAFVSTSYRRGPATIDLSLLGADTTLNGNGPAPEQLLAIDRTAVFTYPDTVENRLFMAMLRGERLLPHALRLSALATYRAMRAATVNGDQRDWLACTAAPGELCSVGTAGNEAAVTDAAGNPVPFSPGYDAANNATRTLQQSYGAAGQLAAEAPLAGHENHLFVGAVADQGRFGFRSQTTVATLGADRGTVDAGFLDPLSPVAVDGVVTNLGVYATDTFALRRDLFVTAAARFNQSWLSLDDLRGGALGGRHDYHRLNPALGVSYQPHPAFGVYAGYSESARVPTPVELTCASPTDPCRLPNAFVADPPLAEVVARTFEAGVRGIARRGRASFDYALAGFRTENADDILFVSSGAVANQGYFANVGDTRRQGLEASLLARHQLGGRGMRLEWVVRYTLMEATFESPFVVASANHPDAVAGSLAVPAGARLPGVPSHVAKLLVGWISGFGLSAGANVVINSSQFLRGDEANTLAPIPGYAVVNLRAAYQVAGPLSLFVLVNNLLDAGYATFGVLGSPSEVLGPAYTSPRFVSPGGPRALWVGVDLRY